MFRNLIWHVVWIFSFALPHHKDPCACQFALQVSRRLTRTHTVHFRPSRSVSIRINQILYQNVVVVAYMNRFISPRVLIAATDHLACVQGGALL